MWPGREAERMLAVRMKDDATKERKSEERKRKRKQAEEVQRKQAEEVKQPKLKTRYDRESRQPKESYKPATKRRFKPIKVKCMTFYSDHMPPMSHLLTFTLFSASDCVLFILFSRKYRRPKWTLNIQDIAWTSNFCTDPSNKVIMCKIITQTTCHGWASYLHSLCFLHLILVIFVVRSCSEV